jgi:hypothetical protein
MIEIDQKMFHQTGSAIKRFRDFAKYEFIVLFKIRKLRIIVISK